MQAESYAHGEPSWQDQSSADAAKAAEFYSALFGWNCPEGDPQFGGYRECTLDGKKVAGISAQMQPGPAIWSIYINVDNADEVAQKIAENGGQVALAPMKIGEYGTMAVFSDPTGAFFGVWQPGTHQGAEIHNQPGAVCWYELITTDVDAAGKFYSAVFGWVAQRHGPSEGPGGYSELKLGEQTVAGMMAKPPMMPAEVPAFWGVYFAVADVDAAAAKATELGGKVLVEPKDIPPGRFSVIADPTGAAFNVLTSGR